MFTLRNGDRPRAPNAAIVITGDKSHKERLALPLLLGGIYVIAAHPMGLFRIVS